MLKREKIILLITSSVLGLIPFFWIGLGKVDIGGDASRLYFIDPIAYLVNFSLYNVLPQGTGIAEPNFFSIPFIILIYILKNILGSSYLTITLFNSFKLIAAFLSVYFIVKEFLSNQKVSDNKKKLSAFSAGIFYMLTPTMTGNWDRALLSHNQVFINPLIFLLILKFVHSSKSKFIWWILLISFIFSNSFAYTSAPPFFAFFPLSILFLFIYGYIFKYKFSFKKIIFGFILFLGLQSFHLIPQIASFMDPGSYTNTRFFDKESIVHEGARYFESILSISRLSNYVLLSYGRQSQYLTTLIPTLILILGFIFNKNLKKLMILTFVFYLIALFLLSGKITNLGSEIYKSFFYLPGFSMFRNFIGQWLFVFSFFNSLLLGFSIFSIVRKLGDKLSFSLVFLFILVMSLTSLNFINGEIVNKVLLSKNNTRIAQELDPNFLKTLDFVKNIPTDSKILVLPLTDAYYQVIPGKNNQGAYIGPSAFSYIGYKKDFVGYQTLEPFSDEFLKLVKEKKYEDLDSLFSILGIHYIVYNSSPFVLDQNNEDFLYQNVRNYLPNTQNGYKSFIENLDAKEVETFGSYKIYKLPNTYSHIYSPKEIIVNNDAVKNLSGFNVERKKVLISKSDCKKVDCKNLKIDDVEVGFRRISPTKYNISLNKIESDFIIVFSEAFHKEWRVFLDNNSEKTTKEGKHNYNPLKENILETLYKKEIQSFHFTANNYSNGWIINKDEFGDKSSVNLILELRLQRVFYISAVISILSLAILIIWGYNILKKKIN